MAEEVTHNGVRVKPGEVQFTSGKVLPLLEEHPDHFITMDAGEYRKLPKEHQNKDWSVIVRPKTISKEKSIVNDDNFVGFPDENQKALVYGLDIDHPKRMKISEGIHSEVALTPPYVIEGLNNNHVFIKHNPDPQTTSDWCGPQDGVEEFPPHVREEAFHSLAKNVFGLNNVPTAVALKTPFGDAVAQEWTNGQHVFDSNSTEAQHTLDSLDPDEVHKSMLMDFILGNEDRHEGNFKVESHKYPPELKLFDHGFAFGHEYQPPQTWSKPEYISKKNVRNDVSSGVRSWLRGINPQSLETYLSKYRVPQGIAQSVLNRLTALQGHVDSGTPINYQLLKSRLGHANG